MFESHDRLQGDVADVLDALRGLGAGRYAALFDRRGVLGESPRGGEGGQGLLRRLLESRAGILFKIPAALHSGEELEDHFAEWSEDEFFLAFVNGKVGVLVACADAKRLEQESGELLKLLVDRLLRLNRGWRLDEKGRGILARRPRLDTVAILRAGGEPEPGAGPLKRLE